MYYKIYVIVTTDINARTYQSLSNTRKSYGVNKESYCGYLRRQFQGKKSEENCMLYSAHYTI